MTKKSNTEYKKKKKEKRKIKKEIKNSQQIPYDQSMKKMNEYMNDFKNNEKLVEEKQERLEKEELQNKQLEKELLEKEEYITKKYEKQIRDKKILWDSRIPSKPSDDILLDTMIIHSIFSGTPPVVKRLQNMMNEHGSKLILLDRVVTEFINMEKANYGKSYNSSDVTRMLFDVDCSFKEIELDKNNEQIMKIISHFSNIRELDEDDLSEVDTFLLEIHLTQLFLSNPASLLTWDINLQSKAYSQGRPTMHLPPLEHSPNYKKLNPH